MLKKWDFTVCMGNKSAVITIVNTSAKTKSVNFEVYFEI